MVCCFLTLSTPTGAAAHADDDRTGCATLATEMSTHSTADFNIIWELRMVEAVNTLRSVPHTVVYG